MSTESTSIVLKHEGMVLDLLQEGNSLKQLAFVPEGTEYEPAKLCPAPLFQLAKTQVSHGFGEPCVSGFTDLPAGMTLDRWDESDQSFDFYFTHPSLKLSAHVHLERITGCAVLRSIVTFANQGDVPVTLTQASSMNMQGIAIGGELAWNDNRKVRMHYCRQTWEGEGQWRASDLEELGLIHTSVHPCGAAARFWNIGSHSTTNYVPMAVIEDLETNQVWYFQIETSSSWYYEVGYRSTWDDPSRGGLFMHANAANERHLGWTRVLNPGDTFTTEPVGVGCCNGDFEDAIRELTFYRRSRLKPAPAWDGEIPMIYNDYMNALWGNPTEEGLMPLIDAVAETGADVFAIDAGWFTDRASNWGSGLGDWQPSSDRFGEKGLQNVLDYITAKDMVPGLWLEMEVCSPVSEIAKKPDDWFLLRNGARVLAGGRYFMNMTNPAVRDYLHATIDRLIGMGVGYFKNDYNACIGRGAENAGSSAADGLLNHIRAFYAFIDEVRAKHPTLILENCGGGAMRQDYGILSHFHLQSSSDQEIHTRYPSVIGGSLATVLPEQLGIWAYPMPLLFLERDNPDILTSEAYQTSMADGEQTIFNMVSGLIGNCYLSGHLQVADDLNFSLIKEGVALYKAERTFIRNAWPTWPLGFTRFNDSKAWLSAGITDGTRLLLAVWRLDTDSDTVDLPLSRWQQKDISIRQIYPSSDFETEFAFDADNAILRMTLPKPNSARLFEIYIK